MSVSMPKPLTAEEISDSLRELPGWSGDERGLSRRLEFGDFRGAMRFMAACVEGCERQHHHPTWTNVLNRVDISLATLDSGNVVTQLDVELARYFEALLRDQGQQFGYVSAPEAAVAASSPT